VILSAAYLLWMFRRVMQGPFVHDRVRSFRDLTPREILTLVPVVVLMFGLGFFPGLITKKMDATVVRYIHQVQEKKKVMVFDPRSPREEPQAVVRPDTEQK